MYFIFLSYTNGTGIRLPQPYTSYYDAFQAMLDNYPTNSKYTAGVVSD
jgi:hypothetical protein